MTTIEAPPVASPPASVEEIAEAEVARLREALEKIDQWAKAYPLKVFPEPDFAKVEEALSAAGLSLSQVSASNMRHVIEGVGQIARSALTRPNEPTKETI